MSDRPADRRGLGRGLSALMADLPQADAPARTPDREVPIDRIHPNPDQPRRHFDEGDLADLAASIRTRGVIQPIIVREAPDGDGYQIVAGERRWRASQIAGRDTMPILVRSLTDTEVLEIALVENIQRADLNPVEEAASYRALLDRHGHTQEQLGEALGRSRSHIANSLRLLTLPEDVQEFVRQGKLSAGHARTLVGAPDAPALARRIVADGLSVREAEALMRKKSDKPLNKKGKIEKDADTAALEGDLSAALGMGVRIDARPGGEGRLTITYRSLDQLDDLCQVLGEGLNRAP